MIDIHVITHILTHALLDTLKLIPFLFLTYLLMEFLEHRSGDRLENAIKKSGRLGPLLGGVLGIVPQCGFSAAASSLYAGRIISLGTLMAIFLSTSDEMLPIMLSSDIDLWIVLKILGAKLIVAAFAGFVIDFALSLIKKEDKHAGHIHELCEHEGCHCENGIFRSALSHTLKITLFVLIANLLIGGAVELIGEENIAAALSGTPVLGELIAALIGLIPNCASSVIITELYLEGLISLGSLMSGLLVGAGVGVMVLFRVNKNLKQNLAILGLLYFSGVLFGLVFELAPVAALF